MTSWTGGYWAGLCIMEEYSQFQQVARNMLCETVRALHMERWTVALQTSSENTRNMTIFSYAIFTYQNDHFFIVVVVSSNWW